MTSEIDTLQLEDGCPLSEEQARQRADAFLRSPEARLFDELLDEWERDCFSLGELNITWALDEQQRDGLILAWNSPNAKIEWVRDGEVYRELAAITPPDDLSNDTALLMFAVMTCDALRGEGIQVEVIEDKDFAGFALVFERRKKQGASTMPKKGADHA